MRYPRFIVRRTDMWEDSWTYGDYKQFICNRPNGQTQCARYSSVPGLLWWIGVLIMWICALTCMFIPIREIIISHIVVAMIFAWTIVLPRILLSFIHRELMHAVGPTNNGATRILPGEEK